MCDVFCDCSEGTKEHTSKGIIPFVIVNLFIYIAPLIRGARNLNTTIEKENGLQPFAKYGHGE